MTELARSVWLNELTWEEVGEHLRQDRTCLVPVGTTEQHGPAGPLGLDTYVAIALAEDVARRTGVLSLPPLWFGDSSHHLGLPGTVSLRTHTLIAVIEDIGRSLAHHGFRRILIINGHKLTNLPALITATRNLREHELPHVLFAVADPMNIARGVARSLLDTNEHHAGELEVSQVWFKFPDLVRPDKLSDAHCEFENIFGPLGRSGDLFGSGADFVDIPWTSSEQKVIAPTGQFSDNRRASRDKGRRYHEYMVERLVEFVEWWRTCNSPLGRGEP